MKRKEMESRLYEIASLQQGFFTAQQAKAIGYSDSRFAYHVRQGNWIREGRGIYRLAKYPVTDRPDLVYWSLWSCNRAGEAQGVFSHETALAIHELSDVMPSKYHLSVPRGFRRFHPVPKNLVIHTAQLSDDDIWDIEGYKVTSPERTIRDILLHKTLSEELIFQAICDGLEKGLISLKWLADIAREIKTPRAKRMLKMVQER